MRDELNNSIKKGRNPGLLWESQRQSRVLTVTQLRGSNSCPVCLLFNFKVQSGRIGPRDGAPDASVAPRAATGSAALAAAGSEGSVSPGKGNRKGRSTSWGVAAQ